MNQFLTSNVGTELRWITVMVTLVFDPEPHLRPREVQNERQLGKPKVERGLGNPTHGEQDTQ